VSWDRSLPGATLPDERQPVGYRSKRAFDLIVAVPLLLFFLPLLAMTALLVRISSPGPALYVQQRIGFRGERFGCLKFRSMVLNADEVLERLLESSPEARAEWNASQKLRNDPRITPIGRFLRMSSLDELPQLINVLRGEMSLVGPRPIIDNEVPRYAADFSYYINARPGITGLWQVSGRSDSDYGKRVALDVAYVTEWSLANDVRILFRTVGVVLSARGSW
jgi:exopolysaccharide production protein ExoY